MAVSRSEKAVLLLGHGSKRAEANDTLREAAEAVRKEGGYGLVLPAFLQLERPGIREGIGIIASKGYKDVIVMPYFLYMGLHVTKDIPEELEAARKEHPGVRFTVTENLGLHDKLIDIAVERIEAVIDKGPCGTFDKHPIEKESFRLIGMEMDEARFSPLELPVIKRVIHTTADFDFQDLLRFSPGAIEAGISAIKAGARIITDVRMVEAGIMKYRLSPFGSRVSCFSSDPGVARMASEFKLTKTAASMRKAAPLMKGAVVAVGNAPTALSELVRIVREGGAAPALVIGVPVGFVGAAEAKEELMASGLPFIATRGRKGGSTVAVAIVNALLIEATETAAR